MPDTFPIHPEEERQAERCAREIQANAEAQERARAIGKAKRQKRETKPEEPRPNIADTFALTDEIIAYEQGELNEEETLHLFQYLVDTDLAWRLQGHYGRTAYALLQQGLIQPKNR